MATTIIRDPNPVEFNDFERIDQRFSNRTGYGRIESDTAQNLKDAKHNLEKAREFAERYDNSGSLFHLREARKFTSWVADEINDIIEAVFAIRYNVHTVVRGDTLWAIAEEYLGNGARYPEIFELNRDVWTDNGRRPNPDRIFPGWKFRIPDEERVVPRRFPNRPGHPNERPDAGRDRADGMSAQLNYTNRVLIREYDKLLRDFRFLRTDDQ